MPINYKDISELTEETNIAGTEKVPVSGTKYVLFNKIKDWIINSLKTTGLDLGGKNIKNGGFEVVTSLPTTNRFVGRQVTYQGRIYIWDGSKWKCDADTLGGYNLNYFKKGVGKGSYYKDVVNISYHGTPTEILIKTKIPFISSVQMPLIHLEGYAYGDASPIELRIAFYIYNSSFVSLGCTSTCPWNPTIKLFTYIDNSTTYVGIALIKSIYFPQCTINYIDVWGAGSGVQGRNYSENWTIEYNTDINTSIVPTDKLATVPYRPIANSITGNAATATDSDKLDGYHASAFAQSNHTHDYNLLANLPDIYNANHVGVPTDDFNTLYDYQNDVWLCSHSMCNAPLDNEGNNNASYNTAFDNCVIQQFGLKDKNTKVQVLYITTGDVTNISMGYIFYRMQGDKWKRIATHSDIANLQSLINSLVSTVNSKQDKMSETTVTPSGTSYANRYTFTPTANRTLNINCPTTQNLYVHIYFFNSLEEAVIIVNNNGATGTIDVTFDADYKVAGMLPFFTAGSKWIISIFKGILFFNQIN